jgi:hypothetical protein
MSHYITHRPPSWYNDHDQRIKGDIHRLVQSALAEAKRAQKAANGRAKRTPGMLSELIKKLAQRPPSPSA